MALGRPIPRLNIAPSERETLSRWTRRRTTAQGLALRARIVLECAKGRPNNAVAAELLDAGRTTRGFAPPDIAAVSQAGVPFIQLVLDSYYQERITSRDVSEYLGVKLKHLASIEERVMGRHVMFA